MKTVACPKCKGSGLVIDQIAHGAEQRQFRLSFKISLRAVARHMRISPMFLSDLERGRRNWSPKYDQAHRKAVLALAGV